MDWKPSANLSQLASPKSGSQPPAVLDLAKKQEDFERLIAIQAERRQKEDVARSEEQRFVGREESLVRGAYNLSMAKASFHAEKISWKRAMEDEVRKEEDARRAMEDARRAIEDERRKREEQAQMALDADVKEKYERLLITERTEKERTRRWLEEDRLRALEDVLIRQDVLDLGIHASLKSHVRKHFDALIGYGATTKQESDAQVDALLDALFVTQPPHTEPQGDQKSSNRSSSLSSSGVLIEPPEAPPSYQAAISSTTPAVLPSTPSHQASPSPNTRSLAPLSISSPNMSSNKTVSSQADAESALLSTPVRYPSLAPSSSMTIEVDDFAVLDDEEAQQVTTTKPALNVPVTSSLDGDEESDYAFDLTIQSSAPLGTADDWEVVMGRMLASSSEVDSESRDVVVEGADKNHTAIFASFREHHLKESIVAHEKQLTRMLSDVALRSLLDPKLSDFNPFSKLVLSTRDTWDSCGQCGTYFDRMSVKQTCRTCGKSFCSKCGLLTRLLDLSILTSRVPNAATELKQLFPKTKEERYLEVKCCNACDAALNWALAKDSHEPNQRSNFFKRQYDKQKSAKEAVLEALARYEEVAIGAKSTPNEIEEAERNLHSTFTKYQSCIDSVDQSIFTIREELPINPKTGTKFTSSTEIRTLLGIKTTMTTFLLESKQLATQTKIKIADLHQSQPHQTLQPASPPSSPSNR